MDLKLPFKITKEFQNVDDAFSFCEEIEAVYDVVFKRFTYGEYGNVYVEVELEEV